MAYKTLIMTFLNAEDSRASISLAGVRDDITEAVVSAAMDIVVAKNIFHSAGGDLVTKHAAQITERNVTELTVR